MLDLELTVKGRSVYTNGELTSIVRTSIGLYSMHVLFDVEEWRTMPTKVSFGNGDVLVTESLVVTAIDGSNDWVAEAYCTVPREVMAELGTIRVTFQAESGNNRIITAAASPWNVVECGDVLEGSAPETAPTISEYEQAYADAVQAANDAASLVANLQDQLDDMVADALAQVEQSAGEAIGPATESTLGLVMPDNETLTVDEDGVLSAADVNGITTDQANALANLRRLAAYDFDSTFDATGTLEAATVKPSALPIATSTARGAVQPDGSTVEVGQGGTLSVVASGLADGESIVAQGGALGISGTWLSSQLATLDGALKYKGAAASTAALAEVESPSTGDLYFVGDVSYFWDGEDWAVISPDLAPYLLASDVAPISAAEVHAVTSQHGSWGSLTGYVTQAYLDAALAAHKAEVEGDVEDMLEAMVNGTF